MTLPHLLRAGKITLEMIDRRNTLRDLYGDRYPERVKDARRIVQGIAERDKKSLVAAGLWICQKALEDGNGGAVNLVIAAMVDLYEEEENAGA